jgi:hypothetical protein
MKRQNITLSLPKKLILKAKHLAVEQGKSLSGMLAEYIEEIVDDDHARRRARTRIERRLEKGLDLGTRGRIPWTRDEIHDR